MTHAHPTLLYFNGKGRGETSRLMFAEAKVHFEDKRVEFADWPKVKPTTPTGQMPVLTLADGKQYAESRAVDRIVARLCHLYGKDDHERAVIDYIYEIVKEAFDKFASIAFAKGDSDEEKKKKMGDYYGSFLPPLVKAMETQLKSHAEGKHHFTSSVSLADIVAFDFFSQQRAANANLLQSAPALNGLIDRVGALPNIAAHVRARPAGHF